MTTRYDVTEFTQELICEKLPQIIKPSARKYLEKEYIKALCATQFIGQGAPDSSTARYKTMYDELELANTGRYTENDIIWVSSNGRRKGRVVPVVFGRLNGVYNLIAVAMHVGSKFIMDTPQHIEKTKWYNVGEIELAHYMENNNYIRRANTGLWIPNF